MDPSLLLSQTASQHAASCLSRTSTQSSSENNLKFICEFKLGPGPTQTSANEGVDQVRECVSVVIPAQCSVYQLRLRICMQVGQLRKTLVKGVLIILCCFHCKHNVR